MNYSYVFILFSLLFASDLYAQDPAQKLSGTISFITSKNVYVKFDQTDNIKIGDSLQLKASNSPCLLVVDKSSSSVVCSVLNTCKVTKGDEVVLTFQKTTIAAVEEPHTGVETTTTVSEVTQGKNAKDSYYSEQIRGRFSASSYNTFSDTRGDRHRINTRFSMHAKHIGDSKFSIDTYLNYRSNLNRPESNSAYKNSVFRVYNLAVRFDATPTFYFRAGRKINSKISSVGAIDGVQVEKYFGKFYVGGFGGVRPNFINYGFDSDLLQYGGYVGAETAAENFYSLTSLGFLEQKNGTETDRRYAYFQHSSTIARKLNLFSSFELDLFGNVGDETRLTNLYVSGRYRFSRKFDLTLSYDSRRRIIYYETYKTEIEQLLDEDIARQGVRVRINVKPIKRLIIGGSYSTRFQSDNENKSNNIYLHATLTKIPGVDGGFSVNYNINSSNYLESNILSFRHSRSMLKNKLNTNFYYRLADYKYNNNETRFQQSYYGTDLSYTISRTWLFSVSGEFSQFNNETNIRIYTRLTKRFYSKKKKQ
jgi:hypothetical protein